MEAFPFTDAEWASVKDAALPMVNATLVDDAVLHASCLIGLLDVLAELRARHGDHPVLLETEADFTEDSIEQVALYRRAVGIATSHGLPTLGIRLSLARVLLDSDKRRDAEEELRACEGELGKGDESDRTSWEELLAKARQARPGAAPDPAT